MYRPHTGRRQAAYTHTHRLAVPNKRTAVDKKHTDTSTYTHTHTQHNRHVHATQPAEIHPSTYVCRRHTTHNKTRARGVGIVPSVCKWKRQLALVETKQTETARTHKQTNKQTNQQTSREGRRRQVVMCIINTRGSHRAASKHKPAHLHQPECHQDSKTRTTRRGERKRASVVRQQRLG